MFRTITVAAGTAAVIALLAITSPSHTVTAPDPAIAERAAARARLDEQRKRIEPAAAKMGMTVDEYLATGKAINDAVKRYGP
jgi:hypothetical protein